MQSSAFALTVVVLSLAAVSFAAPVTAPAPPTVLLHQEEGNQCNDLTVNFTMESSLDQVDEWWTANKYKYATYTKGLCSGNFTVVEHLEHPIGVHGVSMREMGLGMTEFVAAMAGAASPAIEMDCSFNDTATFDITLVRNASTSGNVKILTCRTGVGCTGDAGKWNSYKPCEYKIGPDSTTQLKFQQKVAYFIFYNTATEAQDEFWRPKDGTWPSTHTVTV